MGIRLEINHDYAAANGVRVRVLAQVSSDHIGITKTIRPGVKVFVPVPFYRCQFTDTREVVFYSQWGNILSAEPGSNDKGYALVRRIA